MAEAQEGGQVVRFIRDIPPREDRFRSGAHARIAAAIGETIASQPDLRVVGLLGEWGSGKSTVVRLLEAHLKAGTSRRTLFVYDAWENQSESPRRAFLESFIDFLDRKSILDKDAVASALKSINEQVENIEIETTPRLTLLGRILLFVLLFAPLGMQFVRREWIILQWPERPSLEKVWPFFVGLAMMGAAPAIALLVLLARWIRGAGPQAEDPLALLVNKAKETRHETRRKGPEPTAIEFRKHFREIISNIGDPTLVIVVDNVDRLPANEALTIWSAVRSLFLKENEEEAEVRLPLVLLPVDHRAVVSLLDGVRNQADALFDKTFDVTFHVPPPVLSEWQEYADQQLHYVFQDIARPEWSRWAKRFIERYASTKRIPLTPRGINTAVNNMAVLWTQWRGEEISFASIAYFAVYRAIITADISAAINKPEAGIEEIDPNWQGAIAAFHYGVPPRVALQVLIEQHLPDAIEAGDSKRFIELSEIPGFATIFEQALERVAAGDLAMSPAKTSILLNSISKRLDLAEHRLWHLLRRSLLQYGNWDGVNDEIITAIEIHLEHCDAGSVEGFLNATLKKLRAIGVSSFDELEATERAVELGELLIRTADVANLPTPQIAFSTDPLGFITVLVSAQDGPLVAHLSTDQPHEVLLEQLGVILRSPNLDVGSPVRAMAKWHPGLPWENFANGAAEIIRQGPDFAILNAIVALGVLREYSEIGRNVLTELASDGVITRRFAWALAEGDAEIAGAVLALIILCGIAADPPYYDWREFSLQHENVLSAASDYLDTFDSGAGTRQLIDAVAVNGAMAPALSGIVSMREGRERLKGLDAAAVVERARSIQRIIGWESRGQFWTEAAELPGFWKTLDSADDDTISAVFDGLLSGQVQLRRTAPIVVRWLERVATEGWLDAIRQGAPPYPLAGALFGVRPKAVLRGNLFQALWMTLSEQVSSPDVAVRDRWFTLAEHLSAAERETLYKSVRDQLASGSSVTDLAGLVRRGGRTLFVEGHFARAADGIARNVFLPLMNLTSELGLLLEVVGELQGVLQNAPARTRKTLKAQLSRRLAAAEAPEELEQLMTLRRRLGRSLG